MHTGRWPVWPTNVSSSMANWLVIKNFMEQTERTNNTGKCLYTQTIIFISFTCKRHQLHIIITTQANAKYLGVTFGRPQLGHIKTSPLVCKQTLVLCAETSHQISITIRQCAYPAVVRPRLEYAAAVWDPRSAQHQTPWISATKCRHNMWTMNGQQ